MHSKESCSEEPPSTTTWSFGARCFSVKLMTLRVEFLEWERTENLVQKMSMYGRSEVFRLQSRSTSAKMKVTKLVYVSKY